MEYLFPLQKLNELVLQNQITNDRSNLPRIEESFNNLRQVDNKLGLVLETREEFAELETSYLQNTGAELQQQIQQLREEVGNTSNLILDPELDTYYLMDAILLKLPLLQTNLGEISTTAQQIVAIDHMADRSKLLLLSGIFAKLSSQLSASLQTSIRNNPKGNIYLRVWEHLGNWEQDSQKLIDLISRENLKPTEIENVIALAAKSINNSSILWQSATRELDLLLGERVNKLENKKITIVAILAISIAAVTYFFIGFYASVMNTILQLKKFTERMITQRDNSPLILETKDELAEIVMSFNVFANALSESELKFRSIFENSINGIFQTTIDGKYQGVNPALAQMYGYSSPQDLMDDLTDIAGSLYVEPGRREEFQRQIALHGKIEGFESAVYRKDGTIIWISENARAVKDENAQVLYYEGSVEDITKRKEAELALSKATAEILELNDRLKAENLKMAAEINITRQLQQMILPRQEDLEGIANLDIAGFMSPADAVGGDYYDVLYHDGRVKIGIGDVTGHGLESGVLMLMAQTAVSTMCHAAEVDPCKFFQVVNRVLYDNVQRMGCDKSMTLIILDYHDRTLHISGQHEEVIVLRQGEKVERIDTIDLGFPIALTEDIEEFVQQYEVHLAPGDVVVLYTDGITEAENKSKEQFGIDRLCSLVVENAQKSAAQIRGIITNTVEKFIGSNQVYDDITLVVIKQL